jgi:hypothetical protein
VAAERAGGVAPCQNAVAPVPGAHQRRRQDDLISIVCGIVTPTTGTVLVDGHDILRDYRAARARIGLVPQELSTDMFEMVTAGRLSSCERALRHAEPGLHTRLVHPLPCTGGTLLPSRKSTSRPCFGREEWPDP